MTERIQFWRRLVEILQGAVILGLPFVRVKGQSAFRFDIPSLEFYFFGVTLFMDEFFIVLVAFIFLSFLFVFVTLMFGRVWCGWVCPQTVLIDYTGFVDKAAKKGILHQGASYGALFGISVIVSASLVWYFVSPYEFIGRLLEWRLGGVIAGFWIVLAVIIFLNYAFLRHKWCATVCPYAKLQSVMFDQKSLVIAFDPRRKEECINCMACVRRCPVGIDIREGLNDACIHCAACIDECTRVLSHKGSKGLIGYFWGLPAAITKGTLRTNALLMAFLTAGSLFFLIYMAATRTTLDLTVLPNFNSPPRIASGKAVNSFVLFIENRSGADEELTITVRGLKGSKVIPSSVEIKKGEERKIAVYVIGEDTRAGGRMRPIQFVVESGTGTSAIRKTDFIFP